MARGGNAELYDVFFLKNTIAFIPDSAKIGVFGWSSGPIMCFYHRIFLLERAHAY